VNGRADLFAMIVRGVPDRPAPFRAEESATLQKLPRPIEPVVRQPRLAAYTSSPRPSSATPAADGAQFIEALEALGKPVARARPWAKDRPAAARALDRPGGSRSRRSPRWRRPRAGPALPAPLRPAATVAATDDPRRPQPVEAPEVGTAPGGVRGLAPPALAVGVVSALASPSRGRRGPAPCPERPPGPRAGPGRRAPPRRHRARPRRTGPRRPRTAAARHRPSPCRDAAARQRSRPPASPAGDSSEEILVNPYRR
jgi:hypothetical protein